MNTRHIIVAAAVGALIAVVAPAINPATAAHADAAEPLRLRQAVAQLAVAGEHRDGFSRAKFRHWVDADADGCSTRAEVLLAEAVTPPQVMGRCVLTGGSWHSFYDDAHVDVSAALDIDHMVPLAEAWDSGAHAWPPHRREAFANDLDEPAALWAVTARSNRSKADRDPSEWIPPHQPAVCGYLTAWVTIKTRWALSADPAEHATLDARTAHCPNVPITTSPAPR